MASILIVDDDSSVAEMLSDLFGDAGYDVHVLNDGKDVAPYLLGHRVDLLVLDLLIPHINGFAIMQMIRADPTIEDLPIILMSGIYRSRNHREETIEQFSVIEYFDKPLPTGDLLVLVTQTLGPGSDDHLASHTAGPAVAKHELPLVTAELIDSDAQLESGEVEQASSNHFLPSVFSTQGKISATPVAALLGELWNTQRSGALLLRRDKIKKIVYLRKGNAFAVKSNRVSECLGRLLVRERLITDAQCKKSIEKMKIENRRQGEILVAMGAMTEKNLKFTLELQLEAKLFETLRWEEGDFRFNGSAKLPEKGPDLEWQGAALIVEGIRQTFDETRLRSFMLPVLDVQLQWTQARTSSTTGLGFTTKESMFIERLIVPQTSRNMLTSTLLTPADALRVIYSLVALRWLEPAR